MALARSRRKQTPEERERLVEREALAAEVEALTKENVDRRAYVATRRALTCQDPVSRRHFTEEAFVQILRDKGVMRPPLPDTVVAIAARVLTECNETGFGYSNNQLWSPVLNIVFEHGYRSDDPDLAQLIPVNGPAEGGAQV